MMGVERVVLPRLALVLRGAGSEALDLLLDRRPESVCFDRGRGDHGRSSELGAALRRRLLVRDPQMREFDQTGQLRQGIFGLRLPSAGGPQAPLEFVEVDLVGRTWPGTAHIVLIRRGSLLTTRRTLAARGATSANAFPRGR